MVLPCSTRLEGALHVSYLCERCRWSGAVYRNNGGPFGVDKIKEKSPYVFETLGGKAQSNG